MAAELPWSVTVRLGEIPETGRHVEIAASEGERAAAARVAGVDGIERLGAVFDLTRRSGNGLQAVGRVTATVRQTCVVSLEPVINEIDEAIDVAFAPSLEPVVATDDTELVRTKRTNDEAPEPLTNGVVDLGALATEFLVLAVDRYPRKPGVQFDPPRIGDAAAHPFAALAALKKKSGEVKG
jgi:uncharacterized protein DUF177 involved in 23S rRNA accumulation